MNKIPNKIMDADNKWTDAGQLGRELERVKTECVELRRQNERLVKLLEQTRHYSIGPLVPTTWFMERDKALAAQPEEKT